MEGRGARLVVVGGDAAGLSAAVQAKREAPGLEVVVFEAGPYVSYSACGMPYYLAGEVARLDLLHADAARFAAQRDVSLHLGHRVTALDGKAGRLRVAGPGGERVEPYDFLVLATGVHPQRLPALLDFGPEDGVFTLRGLADIERIRTRAESDRGARVVIFGSGFVSLEMAEAFALRGHAVTLVNRSRSLLGRMTHPRLVESMATTLGAGGMELLLGRVARAVRKTGSTFYIELDEGRLQAETIIQGVGVRPTVDYLAGSGIALGSTGGIAVDRFRRTNLTNVFAGGDVSEYEHAVSGEWVAMPLALPANRSGRVAGENVARLACGRAELEPMPPVLGTVVTRLFDRGYARTGLAWDVVGGKPVSHYYDQVGDRAGYLPGRGRTEVVLSSTDDGRLVAAQLLGEGSEVKRIDFFALAVLRGLTLKEVYDVDTSYAPPFSAVYSTAIKTAGKIAAGR